MTKDTSGPAFPTSIKNMSREDLQGFAGDVVGVGTQSDYKGLSIRQYAAIKAMQWLLAECGGADVQYVAMRAVKAADALLSELEK